MPDSSVIPAERVHSRIFTLRGHRVMLSSHLAELYEVEARSLIQAVKRNPERFPLDFMFQLTQQEFDSLRSQIVISKGRGGLRYLPYAFTQEGVAMLSSVLQSPRAIAVNVEIMRAFIRLREFALSVDGLARKLAVLEKRSDERFKVVFAAIKRLMANPPENKRRRPIGFHPPTPKQGS
jgi:hypothetical protein